MKWESFQLADIFEVARGGSPRPIQEFLTDSPDGLNWIMIGDAKPGSKYIASTKKRIKPEGLAKTRKVNEGDFLLTNSMSFGRPFILKTSGCIHDGWLVLSPKSDNVFPDFFYYLLGSDTLYREFTKRAAGAVVKNLNTSLVKKVRVPLPPLAEQKRISAILDAADALRAKRRETLAQLDSLLQSTFLEMFGDPATNPKEWEVVRLSDVVDRLDGGKNVAQSETPTDHRILRVSAVTTGEYRPDESKFLPEDIKVPASQLVRNGDLLISRANTTELIGATAYVWNTPEKMVLPDKIWKFVWKQDANIEPLFVYFVSHTKEFRRLIGSRSSGTSGSMKNIAKSKLLGLPIPRPPRDLQRQFATIVQSVEQQKSRLRTHLDELNTLFASLQARAFAGEL